MTHDGPPGGRNGLRRSRTDRVLGGVCAGIAERLGLDALLVRVAAVVFAAVVFALVSGGAAVVIYLVAWVFIKERPTPSTVDVVHEVPPSWPTS
jgi:phage shock protein C